ncbi:MAG TPA: 6-phosphogluconolactonase [Ilumatobacteraceae bacterium]|nr:6-phosphogluconolactonase [Ilumatobacteraceae bacterium]HRB04110.1 6-phosphogluconolactonase [Ilumatobacteraceae bacterium]
MDIHVAPDAARAANVAAEWVARQLRNAVRRRGAATIAVSGGSTPALMFADLAEMDVPWSAVDVWQVDERVAPDGDPARNAQLLTALPLPKRRLHLMAVTARDLRAAARRYATGLPERFDVVHLGMGDDGHTASWPPADPVIDCAESVALSGLYSGFVRMTLTPAVVNAARHRLVLAPGSAKSQSMRRWLLEDQSLPIQRVRRTNTVVVIDDAAATQLPAASS